MFTLSDLLSPEEIEEVNKKATRLVELRAELEALVPIPRDQTLDTRVSAIKAQSALERDVWAIIGDMNNIVKEILKVQFKLGQEAFVQHLRQTTAIFPADEIDFPLSIMGGPTWVSEGQEEALGQCGAVFLREFLQK